MQNISFICVQKNNVVLPPLSEGAYIWKVEGVAINISMSSNNEFYPHKQKYMGMFFKNSVIYFQLKP